MMTLEVRPEDVAERGPVGVAKDQDVAEAEAMDLQLPPLPALLQLHPSARLLLQLMLLLQLQRQQLQPLHLQLVQVE